MASSTSLLVLMLLFSALTRQHTLFAHNHSLFTIECTILTLYHFNWVSKFCPFSQDKPGTREWRLYWATTRSRDLSANVLFTAQRRHPSCQSTNKTKSGMLGADFIPSTSPPHTYPPTAPHPPSPKNLKRWHCGAPLVCSWWPVRSVWCEWAGVEAGGLDSNMQWH